MGASIGGGAGVSGKGVGVGGATVSEGGTEVGDEVAVVGALQAETISNMIIKRVEILKFLIMTSFPNLIPSIQPHFTD